MGALHTCNDNGYNLIINSFKSSEESRYQIDQTLLNRSKVDGIIIPPPLCDSLEILSALKEANIPMVRIAPKIQLDYSPTSRWMTARPLMKLPNI